MSNQNPSRNDEEIDIIELLDAIWDDKTRIIKITLLISAISLIIAFTLPTYFTSSSLLKPNNQSESMSSVLDSYSALAGMAGVSIPGDKNKKSDEAIERLQSFDFFRKYFLPNIKLENLLAVSKWEHKNNEIIYKKKLFDHVEREWVRTVKYPKTVIPSELEAYEQYAEILTIKEDSTNGFITISIKHRSPIITQKWLNLIIKNINESMREVDKKVASRAIEFLNSQYKYNKKSEIQDAISRILLTQMQTLMMSSISEDYVFAVIDAPILPEIKSSPSRILISFFGFLFGFVFSLFFSIVSFHYNKRSLIKE